MAGTTPIHLAGESKDNPFLASARGTVKWFTYKAGKKETQQHANARAYLAAMQYKDAIHQQYQADYGHDVPHYNWTSPTRRTVGQPKAYYPPKGYDVYQDTSWNLAHPGDRKPPDASKMISEGTYQTHVPKTVPTADVNATEKAKAKVEDIAKTTKLKNLLVANQAVMAKMKQQEKEGSVPSLKKHKPFWQRDVLSRIGTAGHYTIAPIGRDVVSPVINVLGRGQAAVAGGIKYASEHPRTKEKMQAPAEFNKMVSKNKPLSAKDKKALDDKLSKMLGRKIVTPDTPDEAKRNYAAQFAANAARPTTGQYLRGVRHEVGQGLKGKTHTDLWSEVVAKPTYQHAGYLKPSKTDNWAKSLGKKAFAVGSSLTLGTATDPLVMSGAGISKGIAGLSAIPEALGSTERVSMAVNRAKKVSEAYNAFSEMENHASRLRTAYDAAKKSGDAAAKAAAPKFAEVRHAEKLIKDAHKNEVPKILIDLHNSGMDAEEIRLLGLDRPLAERTAAYASGALAPTETLDPINHARKIVQRVQESGQKWSEGLKQTEVARAAEEMAQEPAVRAQANRIAREQIKLRRAVEGADAVGAAERKKYLQDALQQVIEGRQQELSQHLDEAFKTGFRIKNVPLERLPGMQKVLRGAYVPFEALGKGLRGTAVGHGLARGFSIGEHFKGESESIRRAAESHGISTAADYRKMIRQEFTSKFTKSQRREIADAIEHNRIIDNPTMEAARQKALDLSNKLFEEYKRTGYYTEKQRAGEGFIHHSYDPKVMNMKDAGAFSKERKALMRDGKKGYTLQQAEDAGLRPAREIDDILIHQYNDALPSMQNSAYRTGILSHYGALSDNPEMMNQMGMTRFKGNHPQMFKDLAEAKKGQWYVPQEAHNSMEEFNRLLAKDSGGIDRAAVLRLIDKNMRLFKTANTVGSISNWVNNTAGDIFLNWMDGVKSPLWYKRSAQMLHLAEGDGPSTLRLGGQNFDKLKVLEDFKSNAPSGGFLQREGRVGKNRVVRGVTGGYETREEFSRLAHFLHAVDDEMKSGATYENAVQRASKRVAKWNIDYSAITPFERALRRNFIPFYTFQRKATPLMLEAMATRPGKFTSMARGERAIQQLLGTPPDSDAPQPEWLAQSGAFRLSGGSDPWFMRNNLPVYSPNRILGGSGPSGVASNVLNQINPMMKMGIEGATKKSLFSGAPITNWRNWWINQIPGATQVSRGINAPLLSTSSKTPKKSLPASLATFAGVPITQLTQNQQQAELKRRIANQHVKQQLKAYNEKLAPYEVKQITSPKHGTYYEITFGGKGGKIIPYGRYRDLNRALEEAWKERNRGVLEPGYKH